MTLSNLYQGDECSALAFYGSANSKDVHERFYCFAADWMRELGFEPNDAGLDRRGVKSIKGAPEKIEKHVRASDAVIAIELSALTPDAVNSTFDFIVKATFSTQHGACLVAPSSIAPLSKEVLLPVATQLCRILKPAYGIGFLRDRERGPSWYAAGVCQGLAANQRMEALGISFWSEAVRLRAWEQGSLRDVYPWSFLTAAQLRRLVYGVSLEQWITGTSARGELIQIDERVVLWDLSVADISAVFRELYRANVIFDWTSLDGASKHPNASEFREYMLAR